MLYECLCGFNSVTATGFYRHIAQFKEATDLHSLVQAKLSERAAHASPALGVHASPTPPSASTALPAVFSFSPALTASGQPLGLPPASTLAPPRRTLLGPLAQDLQPLASFGKGGVPELSSSAFPALAAADFSLGRPTLPVSSFPGPSLSPAPRMSLGSMAEVVLSQVTLSSAATMAAAAGARMDMIMGSGWQTVPQQQQQQQQLRHRRTGGRADEQTTSGGADVDAEEIDCIGAHHTPGRSGGAAAMRSSSGGSSTSTAMQDGLLRAGASLASLLLSGLNPIKLFGLAPVAVQQAGAGAGPGDVGADRQPGSSWGFMGHAAPSTVGLRSAAGMAPEAEAEASSTIAAAESVLLWRDPWRTFRVLGLGLYLSLFWYQLAAGSLLIHPATLLLGAALVYLGINGLRSVRQLGQQKQAQYAADTALGAPVPPPQFETAADQELRVYSAVQGALQVVASQLIPAVAALAALAHRGLSGRHLVTSALAALCLWSGMLLGELGLVSPLAFAMLVYLAAFSLPALYVRSREGLDVMVEDAMRLLLRLLLHSSRVTLAGAAALAFVVMIWASGLGLVLRASAAGVAALAVLLWQARPTAAAEQQQQQG